MGLTVISGLAAIVLNVPVIRIVLFTTSLRFGFDLAGQVALSNSKLAFIAASQHPKIKDGMILQILNPKAYSVNPALYSSFTFLLNDLLLEILLKMIIGKCLVSSPFHLGLCG